MTAPLPTITLVGFGAFGRFIAAALAPYARLSVLDRADAARGAARALGHEVIDTAAQIASDIVILAVPVQTLHAVLTDIAPHLRPGQLVIDVCSIKEEPARLMHAHLPDGVEVLATHPMFGPASAARGLARAQIVLCPIRGRRWHRLAAFLRQHLRLKIIVTTPEDHDRQAATTQGLTHLLARAIASLGDQPRIRTRSFDLMSEALAMVAQDAPEVYEAVTRGNRHVGPLRDDLIRALACTAALDSDSPPA